MSSADGHEASPPAGRTMVECPSDREVLITRTVDASARLVYEAWTKPELFRQWWIPKSMGMTLISCDMDARAGGGYRLLISHPAAQEPMAFFGRYVEATPHTRLAWTNDEAGEAGQLTTVTFDERDGRTCVVVHERYPSREAVEAAGGGAPDCMAETLDQLDTLLAGLVATTRTP